MPCSARIASIRKRLGRTGLRKMYIGTLTLALFLATFIAMMLALALGNQLARPLFLLAQGTKEVAEGDYTPKREINSRDELGFLTQSFNAMTRQLSEARAAVENNRIALEHSKAYLESILANLTAGVFVFDRQFRLATANRGRSASSASRSARCSISRSIISMSSRNSARW